MKYPTFLAILLVLLSCDNTTDPKQDYVISGNVRFQIDRFYADGSFSHTYYLNKIDSVPVNLLKNDEIFKTTHTGEGDYVFNNIPEGDYTVQVKISDEIEVHKSAVTTDDIDTVKVDTLTFNNEPGKYELTAFPNPFSSEFDFTFFIEEETDIFTGKILSVNGEVYNTHLNNEECPPGKHWVVHNEFEYPRSIYFISLENSKKEIGYTIITNIPYR